MRTDQIERFYLSLTRCGDPDLRLVNRLNEAGFCAFGPRDQFIDSFCGNADEREAHRTYTFELAKMNLSRQEPREWWEHKVFYRSPFIDELKMRRDAANGCDGTESRSRYPDEPWRLELDPCQSNMTRARMKDRASFEVRWKRVREDEARLLASESSVRASALGRDFTFDAEGRHAFLHRVLERDTAPLGFTLDKQKPTLAYSVFSKNVLADLDLCWTLEDAQGLSANFGEGHYNPSLQLRRTNVRGRLARAAKIDPVNLLVINYALAVNNFTAAYRIFRNLDELETITQAHLCLYGLMAPLIDDAVQKAFA